MDMSDFTSAENKKMTTENDIPTFNPPIGDRNMAVRSRFFRYSRG